MPLNLALDFFIEELWERELLKKILRLKISKMLSLRILEAI